MKISIIVPVYNTEKYLHKCIDSILNQTFEDFELILVDDGSTDSSRLICDEYAKKDERVVVIHKENGGLSSARNAGLDAAKGEYISFIDSDDFITETMMQSLLEHAQMANAEIAITGRINRYEFNNKETIAFKLEKGKIYSKIEAIEQLLLRKEIDVSVCDKLFKNIVFDDIRFPVGETNEDCAIIFRAFLKANVLVHTNTADYYYCHRNNSISNSLNVKKISFLLKNAEQNRQLIEHKFPHLANQAIAFESLSHQITYHNLIKNKILTRKKLSEEEKELLKSSKSFIKRNYRIIRKFACNGKKDKIQLMLIKSGLYGIALKFYYTITRKK